MVFAREIVQTKEDLEKRSHSVVVPDGVEKYVYGNINVEDKWEKLRFDPIKRYFGEIQNSDAILALNYSKNGIENYVGGNVLIEIAFAHVLDKRIYLLNPIPQMAYSDEIEAMGPIIISGDLDKIVLK